MKIPLFDIDSTLIKTGNKAHFDSYGYAVKKVLGINAAITEVDFHGKLDSRIIIDILTLHKVPESEIKKHLSQILQLMGDYFTEHAAECVTLPGAENLLKLLKNNNVLIGVLTGNVKKTAQRKLLNAGLHSFFDFGVYGDMALKRSNLVPLALKELHKIDAQYKQDDLIIVGDSPRDIKCANEANIKVIAVATGNYSIDELAQWKPDLLVNNLKEIKKIIEFLKTT